MRRRAIRAAKGLRWASGSKADPPARLETRVITTVKHPRVGSKEERSPLAATPELEQVIANGIRPSGTPGATGILRDDEIWSIVLYLPSLPRRVARANSSCTRIEP
jgi:hypothetical protein